MSLSINSVEIVALYIHFLKMHCCTSLASADAYLTPCIKEYIRGFTAGFQEGIQVCCMWRMHSLLLCSSLKRLQTFHGRYFPKGE